MSNGIGSDWTQGFRNPSVSDGIIQELQDLGIQASRLEEFIRQTDGKTKSSLQEQLEETERKMEDISSILEIQKKTRQEKRRVEEEIRKKSRVLRAEKEYDEMMDNLWINIEDVRRDFYEGEE